MSIELESESTTPTGHQRSNAFCFCFGPRRRSSWWQRVRTSHSTVSGDRWWSRGIRALKKVREWSEILAGPRWKTFIRRLSHHRSHKRMTKYQYDPFSYALNFDEGQNGDFPDDGFRNFSTRYAVAAVKPVSSPEKGSDVAVLCE
ncbi:uncharacterized protein LOC130714906 [Lotus japonicus]|uniref:uncharacterized protein LOC130714906 n=1 Tax=Lotus japonicus TaxID=34305 RepID=UPI00258C438D|nr:uncharacterized protein LOC130714906 [Lotus japonicus]